ncbi:MAG: hypothetical protein U0939_25050 [Pirellulales bacterium]
MRAGRIFRATVWASAVGLGLSTGCTIESRDPATTQTAAAVDPQIDQLRGKYVLAEAPAGTVTIYDAKRALEQSPEVVLTGRIGAGKHDPWEKGKATFVISDAAVEPSGHEQDPNHDKDNCPFCKRRSSPAETTAIVQFVDEQGEVLAVDAQTLLDAQRDQLVIVRGKGEVNGLGTLVVSVQGIYVKR